MNDKTNPSQAEQRVDLELRKLRADTQQAERNIMLGERADFREWLKTIAIVGAAIAILIKVIAEL